MGASSQHKQVLFRSPNQLGKCMVQWSFGPRCERTMGSAWRKFFTLLDSERVNAVFRQGADAADQERADNRRAEAVYLEAR